MIDFNCIAHVQLKVKSLDCSRPFYRALQHNRFGMTIQYDDEGTFYCIGGRTGVRLRSREDVDTLHAALVERGASIVTAPGDGPWVPPG